MADIQIASLAITLFAIAAGSIFNNVRISDSATALNKQIDDTKEVLRAEMKLGFAATDHKLDEILRIAGEVDMSRICTPMKRWQDRWIHISRGVGNIRGVRFNCRPEVKQLRLIPA